MDDFQNILENGINFGRGGDKPKDDGKVKTKAGKFYYTSCHGVSGWVQSRYLLLADQKQVITDYKKDRYVRKGPKMKAKSIRKIVYREVFMTVDGENGYAKVAYPGQGDGFAWVAKDQLEDF